MVLVQSDTYRERYESADVLEYEPPPSEASRRPLGRSADAAFGRVGLPRLGSRRLFGHVLSDQASWDPSVLVSHNAPQMVPLVDSSRHAAVLFAHNTLLRSYTRRESRRVLDRAELVVCVSKWLAEQTAPHLPRSLRDRLRVLHNGVDARAFAAPEGAEASRTPDSSSLRVLYVGRVVPDKGVHVLVDAVSRLPHLDLRLQVIGSGGFSATDPPTSYETEIRRGLSRLGDRASWMPFQPRSALAPLFHGADVLVVPSIGDEAFALTVLEGMAGGAAVIASRTGGIPEAVDGAGLLVEPNDSNALAEALEGLAGQGPALRELKQAGLRRARRADWGVVAGQWHEMLADL